MKAVNLLPRENLRRREAPRIDPVVALGVALVLAVAAAVGSAFVLERSHARSEQQQLAAARAELARAQAEQPAPGTRHAVLTRPEALAQEPTWRAALEGVLAARVSWDHTLSELSRVIPAGVTLSNLSLGASGPGTPGSLSLTGKASSKLVIVQLLSRLTLVPELDQVQLGSTSVDPTNGDVSFSIQAQVQGPAPPSPPAGTTTGTGTTSTTTTTGGSAS